MRVFFGGGFELGPIFHLVAMGNREESGRYKNGWPESGNLLYLRGMSIRILKLILIGVGLLLPQYGMGQAEPEDGMPGFSRISPRATVETHLKYLQAESYYPELSAKVFQQTERSEEDAIKLAIQLKQVLDGSGYYVELEEIPNQSGYQDTVNGGREIYQLTSEFPKLTLERIDGEWYYSEVAARAIPRLHESIYPFGMDRLLEFFPRNSSSTLFGIAYWQYAALFMLILLCFLVHRFLTWLFARGITKVLLRWGYKFVAYQYVRPLAVPISLLAVSGLVWLLEPVLQLPIAFQRYIILALRVAVPFFAFAVLFRMVDVFGVYMEKLADRTETKLDDQLVPLLRKALRTFVVVVGALVILQNLDVNVTALLAGLSIGGLALALAAQDTLKNFFGSVMIFVDRPFQIGHWITAGEIDGTVEEVGFRSTRVRTFRNSLVSVPNGKLADMVIDNHGLREYRRFFTPISITYDTPPEVIEVFVEGLKEIVKHHPVTRKDYYEIHLNEFDASSLNILFYVFFAVPSWSEELKARHQVMLEVIHLAEKLGVQFAFPTQTLHLAATPEKPLETAHWETDMGKLKEKVTSYLQGAEKRQALWQQEGASPTE